MQKRTSPATEAPHSLGLIMHIMLLTVNLLDPLTRWVWIGPCFELSGIAGRMMRQSVRWTGGAVPLHVVLLGRSWFQFVNQY